MTSTFHAFDNSLALAQSLAQTVAQALSAAISAKGSASLAVSGGSTPKAFFKELSQQTFDWNKVTITLVDERFVSKDSPRSNHGLVEANLLQNKAAAARFVALYHSVNSAEEAAALASRETQALFPFDVVILGMGTDGHTASFFPGGNRLAESLDSATPAGVITMEADGAGEPRLTFTISALQDAKLLVLHIEGNEKKAVLEKASNGDAELEMPIRAILNRASSPVEIYWAP